MLCGTTGPSKPATATADAPLAVENVQITKKHKNPKAQIETLTELQSFPDLLQRGSFWNPDLIERKSEI